MEKFVVVTYVAGSVNAVYGDFTNEQAAGRWALQRFGSVGRRWDVLRKHNYRRIHNA